MNANAIRQQKNANGKLFDVAGRSSLGSLPRGELRIANVPVTSASANTTSDFVIGAEPMMSMSAHDKASNYDARRSESFMRLQGLSRPGTSFRHPQELVSDDRMLAYYRMTRDNLAMDEQQSLSHLPSTEAYLNQGVINPVKRA